MWCKWIPCSRGDGHGLPKSCAVKQGFVAPRTSNTGVAQASTSRGRAGSPARRTGCGRERHGKRVALCSRAHYPAIAVSGIEMRNVLGRLDAEANGEAGPQGECHGWHSSSNRAFERFDSHGAWDQRPLETVWCIKRMVAEDGIEPPTRGFSIPCSTN